MGAVATLALFVVLAACAQQPGPAGSPGPAGADGPAGPLASGEPMGRQDPLGQREPMGRQGPLASGEPMGRQDLLGQREPMGRQDPLASGEPMGRQDLLGQREPMGRQDPLASGEPMGRQDLRGPAGADGLAGPPGPAGADGLAGPPGSAGPPGPAGPSGGDVEIWPELRIDVTVPQGCADRIRGIVEYQGTAADIKRQRERLDLLLAQPSRYMTNRHIERVIEWTQRVDNEGSECDGIGEALDLFRVLRYINPMGKLREAALRSHWSCRYPDGDLLGGGSGSDSGETLVVEIVAA